MLLLVIDAFLGGGIVTTTTTVATTPTKITANLGPALSLSSSKQLSFVNHVIIHTWAISLQVKPIAGTIIKHGCAKPCSWELYTTVDYFRALDRKSLLPPTHTIGSIGQIFDCWKDWTFISHPKLLCLSLTMKLSVWGSQPTICRQPFLLKGLYCIIFISQLKQSNLIVLACFNCKTS